MKSGYKLVISGKKLYREIELGADMTSAKIGTSIDCTFRLLRDLFFDSIELILQKKADTWSMICADNLYITTGDVRKLATKELKHGDIFDVCYRDSNNLVFTIEFLFDFGGNRKYERLVHINSLNRITIGASASDTISLHSNFIADDQVTFLSTDSGYDVCINQTKFGVYKNDIKIQSKESIALGDFLSISDFSFYLSAEGLWTEIRDDMSFHGVTVEDHPNPNEYPKFVRNVRAFGKINEEVIEILDPAAKPTKPKNNLMMSLLPSMGMMLTSGAMAMMGGGTMIVFSIMSAGIAVATAVIGFVGNRKDYKKSLQKRIDEYNRYVENKRAEIKAFREQEKSQLEELYVNVECEQQRFALFSSDLFDRSPKDADFLFVRLGVGAVAAKRIVQYKKKEQLELEDDLQMLPAQIRDESVYIENAPVVCNFKDANAICIIGEEKFRFDIFKNIVFDICARQFFSEVELVFVAEQQNANKISWLRFLPNVTNDSIGGRNIVCDDESKNRIFDYLYKELTQRESAKNDKINFKHIVVFFYDDYGFQRHPISKFISQGSELGITFVFMVESRSLAPVGCSYMIEVQSQNAGRLIDVTNKDAPSEFTYQAVGDSDIENVVSFLAPVYAEEISLEGALTKNISMFEMMNILMVEDIDLEKRWASSLVYKSMAAPIGVTKSGLVYLDLNDKAHGPHGLVAGTTGSGKSEILQTYILSIATLFHPYEISFVIIDFKGGGMVNQFKDLPHLLGAITNIDGKEIDRSLKSIKAELQKRQRLFAEADVNHIDKYIKKYKAGDVKIPIPHLVLIVDEFAELKAEQPDFMKELISAARIGRSLGVHLILATQKPSGQVDDQIWSNSRFKLCLKVQSVEDSNEVLKSPLAAEIKEPGRAYLQVGNNEIFELFQSAYSGSPEKMSDSNVKEFAISHVSVTGKRTVLYNQKKKKNNENNLTQLEAIVRHVHMFCDEKHIASLSNICLPSLSSVIEHPGATAMHDGFVDIGIYDDPDNQMQASTFLDVDTKNTLIIGASQYGKTNFLQSLLKSICLTKSPAEAIFYILDFGSMVFKNFEPLHHVGGVVTSSDDEKLKNLFKLLFEEINRRKEKLIEVGVSSFASYVEAGYRDLPHIYLFVDNFTALSELYLENDDSLLSLVREGLAVGLSVVVANAQTAGIGYRYLSNFANKVALYCNDSNEYTNVFDHVSLRPDEKPGRCIVEIDKNILECQSYLAFEGEKEIDRVNKISAFIEESNAKYPDKRAKSIPCIPTVLTTEILDVDFSAKVQGSHIPIGLTYADVRPFYIDLAQMYLWGICGKDDAGQQNIIAYLVSSLLGNKRSKAKAQIVVFDDISRKYAFLKNRVHAYSLSTDTVGEIIEQWHDELTKRYNNLLLDDGQKENELLLMIIQNNDVAAAIQNNMNIADKFNEIISRYKDLGVCFLFANYPNTSISYDAPDAIRKIKQERRLLCLDDLANLKNIDVPYDALRAYKKPLSAGDGYYINDNDVVKLKLVSFKNK